MCLACQRRPRLRTERQGGLFARTRKTALLPNNNRPIYPSQLDIARRGPPLQEIVNALFNSVNRVLCCARFVVRGRLSVGVWGLIRTQGGFDQYMTTDQALSNGLSEMYAQGLQSGQALRNMVLDPANRRAAENLKNAQDAFSKALDDTKVVAQGTPFETRLDAITTLRNAQALAVNRPMPATPCAALPQAICRCKCPLPRKRQPAF